MKPEELWQATLAQIQLMVSTANFATWFKDTEISLFEKNKVVVTVPNSFVKEWLEQKYHKIIYKILKNLHPEIEEIEYRVGKGGKVVENFTQRRVNFPQLGMIDLEINERTNLNPRYTFSNFVVGSFNELAFAAAQAVVENPGKVYNPLFVYGGVGLGKTHLLEAVGNEIVKKKRNLSVKYLQVNFLVSEIINSIKNKKIEQLKSNFQNIDVLILDDVQFLAGKEKTQEEFFYIFNSLYEKGKQIIISSDRPPKAIHSLAERLRSRFEGGMIADISIPDFETRIAILKLKSQERGVNLKDEILNYIASNIKNNIRELEGALNVLVTYLKLQNKDLNLKTAKALLRSFISPSLKISTFKKVLKVISDFYDVNEKDLLSTSRRREVVKPRQVAMYILREDLKYSFPSIARKFSGKDHTTVIHACEKIKEELRKNEELNEEISQIRNRIFN
jgi:chromosomal replication initiator protein